MDEWVKESRKEAVQHLGLLLNRKVGVHSCIGLDREDELFQSKRNAVLLHIFSKELDVGVEISADDRYELDEKSGFNEIRKPVIPKMFIKIIFCYNFWRFQKWFLVAAIRFVSFADNIGIGSQSPESDRSGSSMAVGHKYIIVFNQHSNDSREYQTYL